MRLFLEFSKAVEIPKTIKTTTPAKPVTPVGPKERGEGDIPPRLGPAPVGPTTTAPPKVGPATPPINPPTTTTPPKSGPRQATPSEVDAWKEYVQSRLETLEEEKAKSIFLYSDVLCM